MDVSIAREPSRRCGRTLAIGLTVSTLAIAIGTAAFAQQPASGPPSAAEPQQLRLIYSPWTKFCLKGAETNARQVCFTGKEGRVESGVPVAAVVLIEPEGGAEKLLRVTWPLGMQLPQGTRLVVDQGEPVNAPYIICLANGCVADYEVSEELIGNMKRGQRLVAQAVNRQGQAIILVLPLNDFEKAYDGPPTDPKEYQEQRKKLRDELQHRAEEAEEEAGKKLEGR